MDEKGILKILQERYFIEGEKTWEDLCSRVSIFFGKTNLEKDMFYNVMVERKFLPNSPALMNAGTDITSYSACFVLPIDDSIDSIFDFYKNAAIISKSGGGVGANFSKIRAKGSTVKSTEGVASGPVSFMNIQNTATEVIKQGGRRRGANMGILDCDHPDIREFICAKSDDGILENFNLSVRVSNRFMSAALDSSASKEHALLKLIAEKACYHGEPGILFADRIQADNYLKDKGDEIVAVNPCRNSCTYTG